MKFPVKLIPCLCVPLLFLSNGCHDSHDHAAPTQEEETTPVTNRIDVPLAVRQNLGITFVSVERRNVADTVRYPGVFELMSNARRTYTTPAEGRIELHVEDYQQVEVGDLLFQINSPELARIKSSLTEALLSSEAMRRRLEAHERHHQALREKLEFWETRQKELERISQAGGGQQAQLADARQNLSSTEAEIAEAEEKHQELLMEAVPYLGDADEESYNPTFELFLNQASLLLGLSRDELLEDTDGQPYWKTINTLDVVALADGTVEPILVTSGALVENSTRIVTVTDSRQLRFRAKAVQSDLSKLKEGTTVRIAPSGVDADESLEGTLSFGLEANSLQRSIDLIIDLDNVSASWARPGVTAIAEVVVEGGGRTELAIPERAVITDGLQRVLFRRNPDDPNQVIRIEADGGVSDGRWLEILSGLREGDEVVVGGIYELMLGSSTDGARQEGGHFHGDGTFHEAH